MKTCKFILIREPKKRDREMVFTRGWKIAFSSFWNLKMSKFIPFESFYLLFFCVKNTKFHEFWSFSTFFKNIKIAPKHFPTISSVSFMVCAVPNRHFLLDFMCICLNFVEFFACWSVSTAPVMQHI